MGIRLAAIVQVSLLWRAFTGSVWQTRKRPMALLEMRMSDSGEKRLSLSFIEPTVIVDTREQEPLVFPRLEAIPGTLLTGDYSVVGLESLFAVERKSIPDLVGCCMGESRERFERELHRLRGFRFKRLLVVGSEEAILAERYRSNIKPQAVLATLGAFEVRYDVPIIFKQTPEAAAAQIERWAHWFSREVSRTAANLSKATKELARG
jgi:DNA excision repair protein ERCC-4